MHITHPVGMRKDSINLSRKWIFRRGNLMDRRGSNPKLEAGDVNGNWSAGGSLKYIFTFTAQYYLVFYQQSK